METQQAILAQRSRKKLHFDHMDMGMIDKMACLALSPQFGT